MTDTQPEPSDGVSEPHEALSDEELEQQLLEAAALPGRQALAAVTALRTILQRRAKRRRAEGFDADSEKVAWLFDESRDPGELVEPAEWHPSPDEWSELDAEDTVAQRRDWYRRLRAAGEDV